MYQAAPVEFDKLEAVRSYLVALRTSVDGRAKNRPEGVPDKALAAEAREPGAKTTAVTSEDVAARMVDMPLEEAAAFLADMTTAWAFAMRREQYPQIFVPVPDSTDQALADAVHKEFTTYFDMWT